jgi:hypothetical protein
MGEHGNPDGDDKAVVSKRLAESSFTSLASYGRWS